MSTQRIGFIGTGVMGSGMIRNLQKAGYPVNITTRTKAKAEELIQEGCHWFDSQAELAAQSDVVISMVGYPQDVESVYFGEHGVFRGKQGGFVIDMTTSSPSLAKKIYAQAQKQGIQALDAPVSGGDIGARQGTLAIMAGGDEAAFEGMKPIFSAMGQTLTYFGPAGSGQYAKMSNQIAIASNMMGVCEAMAYAKKSGLDPEKVIATLSAGAAGSWSLANLAPRMLQGDTKPGFYIKHFLKDMRIAIESAEEMGLDLPGLRLAKKLYDQLADQGMENCGTQALFQWYDHQ